MLQPELQTIYSQSTWQPLTLLLRSIPPRGSGEWITYSGRESVGRAKNVLGFKTKGFVPGKTWSFNPYDVRCCECKATSSSGTVYLYDNYYQRLEAVLDWNGNLANWLVRNDPFPEVAPSQYVCSDADIYRALNTAMEKINTPEADYGVMVAELGETLGMLLNPLAGLQKFIRKVARRKHNYKATLDVLTSSWMEYRYGITPFVMDLQTLMNRVQEITRLKGQTYRCSSKIPVFHQRFTEDVGWAYAGHSGLQVKGTRTETSDLTVYSHVLYTPTIDFKLDPFAGRNLPSILWEVTPLSFVADWFIDVGSWLKAIQVNPDILFYGNTVFSKYRTTIEYNALHACIDPVRGLPISPVTNDKIVSTQYSGYRHVNVELPALPQVNVDLSSIKRKLDSASLIWQNIAKNLNPRRIR